MAIIEVIRYPNDGSGGQVVPDHSGALDAPVHAPTRAFWPQPIRASTILLGFYVA